MKEEFFFDSFDDKKIHYYKWSNNKKPKAILQIAHGMIEHAIRYDEFAEFLSSKDVFVYANDHRGHGYTAPDDGLWGYFGAENGWLKLIEDQKQLNMIIKREYPGVPVVFLGHSMGSFIARTYANMYGKTIEGLIISGTAFQPKFMVISAKIILNLSKLFLGEKALSKMLRNLFFAGFLRRIKKPKTPADWLTRDEEIVQKTVTDKPFCTFTPTVQMLIDIVSLIEYSCNFNNVLNINKQMPVLFFSGSEDPVGHYSNGVKKVYSMFVNNGIKNCELKIYNGGRHEMLNEINRVDVFNDILKWLNRNIKNPA